MKLGSEFLRKNVKLLTCQKERMCRLHATGDYSQRKLAQMFSVSRRLVQFTIDPEKHKANLEARAKRGGSKQYYDKEQHNADMKKHRAYKYKTLKDIKNKEDGK